MPRTIALVALLALLAGCATNPVTGKKELSLMSESQAEQLGAQSDVQIVDQYGVIDDTALAGYVKSRGQAIIPVSHIPDEDFEFRLLDDPVVNAFALPGGYVYVSRGILAYFNSEAALMGVLGHEVGHVAARHSAQRYTQQTLLGLGIGLGAALSEDFAQYAGLAGTAGQLLLLKYSRDDERQSDRLGVEYATRLGYDTAQMAEFFRTLEALSGGGGGLPSWTSTHPDPGERYQTVLELTREWQAKTAGPFRTERDGYLQRLEGLVFGRNPRHGFVDDGRFVHPDLAFRFPVPSGWRVANTTSQVQMGAPEGNAAVVFSAALDRADPAAAAESFVSQTGMQVTGQGDHAANGLTGIWIQGQLEGSQGPLGVRSTFVALDGVTYAFHGFSTLADFAGFRATFASVPEGFARLTDPTLLRVEPVTLHLITTERSAPFAEQVRDHPIPSLADIDVAGLALLNGFEVNETVPAGTILKVLRP